MAVACSLGSSNSLVAYIPLLKGQDCRERIPKLLALDDLQAIEALWTDILLDERDDALLEAKLRNLHYSLLKTIDISDFSTQPCA